MLTLAETPHALLSEICTALASIQDPRARHWLLFPGKGRAETVLKMWADRSGIAAHTQDVELRVLIEQAASANQHHRFDFDRLKLACASVLPEFSNLPDFPIRSPEALTPISAQVLNWASAVAKAIDVGLQCRSENERWPADSFLSKITAHPVVSATLGSHIGTLDPISFEKSTRAWIEDWASRSGVPHLWIQLDAGIPAIQFERLQQFLMILAESYADRIHLFALAPSKEYWGDSATRTHRKRISEDPELHPGALLWSLGRASQDLHQQITDSFLAFGEGGRWIESPPTPDTLLGQLQFACRFSRPLSPEVHAALPPNDASLTIHSARSTLRELEICRDRILQARCELPDLRYEEILLLLADPEKQAPYIQAALRADDPKHPSLPFRLLGLGQTFPAPLSEALSLLLQKLRGRLELEDIQALIESPLIAAKFNFQKASDEGHDLIAWLKDSQFRWGLEMAHRSEFQNLSEHRWNLFWALQRLGLGAIVSPEQRSEPISLGGTNYQTVPLERASGLALGVLAQLARFASCLQKARSIWTQAAPAPISLWNEHLRELADTFLDCDAGISAQHKTKLFANILPQLGRAVAELDVPVTADAYIRILSEKLTSISETGARGSGGICVADLRQYSGVPARLTIIAGLNDDTFPRKDDRPDWHPLSQSRKIGDPTLRETDRHALLLAILACRERLVLTYQGGSDEDSKHRPPCTPLADLITSITETCSLPDSASGFEFKHPLNGFAPEAFTHELPSGNSFLIQDYFAAEQLTERTVLQPLNGIWKYVLPPVSIAPFEPLKFKVLRQLLTEPTRILIDRLGIKLPDEESEIDSVDLLTPDALHRWFIRDQYLATSVEGRDLDLLRERLEASGEIPRARLGTAFWNKIEEELPKSLPLLSPDHKLTKTFKIEVPDSENPDAPWVIEGQFGNGWYTCSQTQEAIFVSASSNKYKHQLSLCLDSLILGALNASLSSEEKTTALAAYYRGSKHPISLPILPTEIALKLLGKLRPLFQLAQQLPLPFWPTTAEAAINATFTNKEPVPEPDPSQINSALEEAYAKWTDSNDRTGPSPSDNPATRYVFRGCVNPMTWTPSHSSTLDWLPYPEAPFAWRIIAYIYHWKREAGL